MHILYSCDNNYYPNAMSSIRSLLDNNTNVKNLVVHLIGDNLSKNKIDSIYNLVCRKYNRTFDYRDLNDAEFPNADYSKYPKAGYCRLMAPTIFQDIRKIIYLDCDTIVCGSLEEMWITNMGSYLFAGVKDTVDDLLATSVETDNSNYINAGVLLINLVELRKFDFNEKVIRFISKYDGNVPHRDQGIINGVAKDRIMFINPQYNVMTQFFVFNESQLMKMYHIDHLFGDQALLNAVENPIIIHFMGKYYDRPWFDNCTHPCKHIYLRYAETNILIHRNKKIYKKIIDYIYLRFPFPILLIVERIMHKNRMYRFKRKYATVTK